MRIFLTGATGFIGSAVVANLIGARHEVSALARSDKAADQLRKAGAEVHRGDLLDLKSLHQGALEADAVIHTAFDHDFSRMADNCEADRAAIDAIGRALIGTSKPLIVTSGLPSIAGKTVTEVDVPPGVPRGTPRVSEQTAMAFVSLDVRVSIIRMPQVHDRQKQGFASYLIDHARENGVSIYVGEGQNRWPAVHRLDAARLYVRVLEKGAAGQAYHAVSEKGISFRDIAEAIGERLNIPTASLAAEDSERYFGWLDRVAQMDAPASSELTRASLDWLPRERSGFVEDIINSA